MEQDNSPLSEDEKQQILANLDKAEWALRLLAEGQHRRLLRYLSGISANYRVVIDRSKLVDAQLTTSLDDALLLTPAPLASSEAGSSMAGPT
ncbi:hypothetical protein [Botrimarina mediterranea]|uniref:Uncharacterized protein n=1 Tax=Botrimarina mediterranea TaxID=2528022 RepID=A0A518K9R8_9BACT|nr:hypothetical protein [Botrimarina mediterranea]QDV74538.1 hypothetical protein Spa11_27420 [Botrimarina mediterranea]QDV79178.1 hypothetical protein K2D_27890 [Planctomycetes bacterium K2D]